MTIHDNPAPNGETQFSYLVARETWALPPELLGPQWATLLLAFPKPGNANGASAAKAIHCGLPLCNVGFGFAVNCNAFVLASNREDLRNSVDSEPLVRGPCCSKHQPRHRYHKERHQHR